MQYSNPRNHSGGTIEFRSVGTVYGMLHFPDGFEISVGRPASAYKMELKDRFPDNIAEMALMQSEWVDAD